MARQKSAVSKIEKTINAETNPQIVEIWPLRSYQDEGEIKRRYGKSYEVPRRHANALISRGLATSEKPV